MAIDRQERLASRPYRSARALLYPASVPTLRGKPWRGAIPALQRHLQAQRGMHRASSTVVNQAAPLRRALAWMRAQWALQETGTAMTAADVAGHGGFLVSSYLVHLGTTSSSTRLADHVARASTAINNWLGAQRPPLPPVANDAPSADYRESLRRSDSHAPRKTPALSPGESIAIGEVWGRQPLYPYQAFVALGACLGVMLLGRFDCLSWISLSGIQFQCVRGVRLVSICLTRRKQTPTGIPDWIDIPDVPGTCTSVYKLLVLVLRVHHGVAVPLDRGFFEVPASASRGLGLLFPAFGASPTGNHRHRFDPALDWSHRAKTAAYRRQLVHAVHEVIHLERPLAERYGMSSMRSGGNTHLRRRGFLGPQRCEFGRWASAQAEAGYDRTMAVEHALSLLDAGVAF